jgi:8-oxo-dGTP pyrophosphatase MutT (NUDIX family)
VECGTGGTGTYLPTESPSSKDLDLSPPTMTLPPVYNFSYDASVAEFAVPKHSYLAARPDASFGYIATSSLVLDKSDKSTPRVLLLQRAASDSDPNLWEPPGGACDDDDETILHAAARELWEEAGLQVKRISGPVGRPYFYDISGGRKVCQFQFAMHVDIDNKIVKLDPNEHQQFLWASEEEVRARKADDVELRFTRDEVERTVLSSSITPEME